MARSQILTKMASKDLDLEKGINFLKNLSEALALEEEGRWSFCELNGYGAGSCLPSYRVLKAGRIIYSGVNGESQVEDIPLPLNIFPPEIRSCLNQNHVNNPVGDIIRFSKSQEQTVEKDLTLLAYEVFHLSGIRAEEIKMQFDYRDFIGLVGHIKAHFIEILIEVERAYGSLDDLYIHLNHSMDNKNQKDIV